MDNETITTALVPVTASQKAQQPAGMIYVSDMILSEKPIRVGRMDV